MDPDKACPTFIGHALQLELAHPRYCRLFREVGRESRIRVIQRLI